VGRRLQRAGAVAIKNSVYVLPRRDESYEDFQWIAREIADAGGEATVCEAALVAGLGDDDVRELFVQARAADYRELRDRAEALFAALRDTAAADDLALRRGDVERELARLRRRLDTVRELDFFPGAGVDEAAQAVADVAAELRAKPVLPESVVSASADPATPLGRTWVTRRDVHVDRIASAWLIRRFIDPDAVFKFVAPQGYVPAPGELRFDMFDAEYTHEGGDCTFETLVKRFSLDDGALGPIGEIVHDADCKDARFERAETAGVQRIITGIAAGAPDDVQRIEQGRVVFDALHDAFRDTSHALQTSPGSGVTARDTINADTHRRRG